jgi:hypothetical protein
MVLGYGRREKNGEGTVTRQPQPCGMMMISSSQCTEVIKISGWITISSEFITLKKNLGKSNLKKHGKFHKVTS